MTGGSLPRQRRRRIWPILIWVTPDERRRHGDNRRSDPTRPFGFRNGRSLAFGIGGHWGSVGIEIER